VRTSDNRRAKPPNTEEGMGRKERKEEELDEERRLNGKVVYSRAFRFAIRIDSPIHFKRIDSNRFVL